MYVSSSLTPRSTCNTMLAAEITSAAANAQPNESTLIELGSIFDASSSTTASRTSTSTKLSASVNGRRSAAMTGESTALRIAITAAAMNASPTPLTATCGTIAAATPPAAADTIQLIASLNGLKRGTSGLQTSSSP